MTELSYEGERRKEERGGRGKVVKNRFLIDSVSIPAILTNTIPESIRNRFLRNRCRAWIHLQAVPDLSFSACTCPSLTLVLQETGEKVEEYSDF